MEIECEDRGPPLKATQTSRLNSLWLLNISMNIAKKIAPNHVMFGKITSKLKYFRCFHDCFQKKFNYFLCNNN